MAGRLNVLRSREYRPISSEAGGPAMKRKLRDYYEERARWPKFNWIGEKERASVWTLGGRGKELACTY